MSLQEVLQALWHQGPAIHQTILWDLIFPRTTVVLLIRAALGMSGVLLQGMLGNGLAEPFILGISAGAGWVAIAPFTLKIFLSGLPVVA